MKSGKSNRVKGGRAKGEWGSCSNWGRGVYHGYNKRGGGKKGGRKTSGGQGSAPRMGGRGRHKGKKSAGKLADKVETLDVRLLTWNVDGFRGGEKRLMIQSCLWEWKVDIAVLTETHLRDEALLRF